VGEQFRFGVQDLLTGPDQPQRQPGRGGICQVK
jgi:hypothetical protein